MGQGLSCRANHDHGLFTAVQFDDSDTVQTLLERDPSLIRRTTTLDRHSALHIAASNGQIEIVSMLLESFVDPALLNSDKQILFEFYTSMYMQVFVGERISLTREKQNRGSADNSVRMFDRPNLSSGEARSPIHIFEGHNAAVLCVQWCPHKSSVFGSSAEDGILNLWDHEKESFERSNFGGKRCRTCGAEIGN